MELHDVIDSQRQTREEHTPARDNLDSRASQLHTRSQATGIRRAEREREREREGCARMYNA